MASVEPCQTRQESLDDIGNMLEKLRSHTTVIAIGVGAADSDEALFAQGCYGG